MFYMCIMEDIGEFVIKISYESNCNKIRYLTNEQMCYI